MITSSVGTPRLRPSSSLPDLMQIPSSPTSNLHPSTSTYLHDSISTPSPFCAFHGLRTVIFLSVRCWVRRGWIHHAGEFWIVTPSINTRLHPTSATMLGRRNSLMASAFSIVYPSAITPGLLAFDPASARSVGYQVSFASLVTPPDASSAFHSASV